MGSIELKKVRKDFAGVAVINGVDLKVEDGEFTVFVGPSGCGKSTLLRLIAGLEDISSGEILIDGKDVSTVGPAQRGLSMVFQSYALYPHMSVRNNIAFALKMAKQPAEMIDQKVKKAAGILNLTDYLDRKPRQLSGGQRQRVAIGRAIVRDPKVFLFDEPLSNLDAALRVATRLEIAKLHHSMDRVTMIYVTHDQVEAMTLADRICVLRDGIVEQVGTPMELYEKPNSIFVAGFIGSPKMNFLDGRFAAPYGAATLGVRPEHIEIKPSGGAWSGSVIHTEILGSDSFVFVDVGATEPVIVRETGKTASMPGQTIQMSPMGNHLHKFDAAGKPIRN